MEMRCGVGKLNLMPRIEARTTYALRARDALDAQEYPAHSTSAFGIQTSFHTIYMQFSALFCGSVRLWIRKQPLKD